MTERIEDFIHVSEVADGPAIAGELFTRKFGDPIPAEPHHVVTFYRKAPGELVVVSYVHFRPFGDICLVGGGCTDGRAFAHMTPAQREAVKARDGLLYGALRYGFERYADRFDGFYGYCGDARAEAVDLRAGFRHTGHPRLLAYFPRPLHPNIERALTAKAFALGPF